VLNRSAGHVPPSALARAAVSLVLLVGFYLVVLGAAAFLFAVPIGVLAAVGRVNWGTLFLLMFCFTPAIVLVKSAFSTRRPRFVAPPRRLLPSEAPALFAAVEDLARQAGTAAPDEVYLDWLPDLSVTEVGGFFRPRRVMTVGAPLAFMLSVDQLRAGVAHEFGHFAGGDTRLTAFSVQTQALFASVLKSTERDPFRVGTRHWAIELGFAFAQALGNGLVNAYGRFFLRVTLPLNRRQELAADALSAKLLGTGITASALDRIAIDSPLYHGYLDREVGYAVRRGAMPTDLASGFARFRERFLAGKDGQLLVDSVKSSSTDPYDTHPALADRLRALEAFPSVAREHEPRPAAALFGDPDALEVWLVQVTRERLVGAILASGEKVDSLRELPWSRIPQESYAPAVKEAARRLAEKLYAKLPTATTVGGMFAALSRHLTAGGAIDVAAHLEPAVRGLSSDQVDWAALEICADALGTLLQGALLERGATIEDSLGSAALVLRLGDERIDTLEAVRLFASGTDTGRSALHAWADRLDHT
jgi:heat shock protein HtpX